MLFWQWTYVTSVYWVSFFVARWQGRITRGEMYTYIGAMHAPWVRSVRCWDCTCLFAWS